MQHSQQASKAAGQDLNTCRASQQRTEPKPHRQVFCHFSPVSFMGTRLCMHSKATVDSDWVGGHPCKQAPRGDCHQAARPRRGCELVTGQRGLRSRRGELTEAPQTAWGSG
jgi:hypothetical protein